MKISALINALQMLQDSHGDIEVCAHDGLDPSDVDTVSNIFITSDYYLGQPVSGDKYVMLLS